ncbi:hypothetical protein HPB49_004273 [Dermacentor silvarum]|uniref:Uncharacterized protein n=1 Tax=Dermacentor silvarum TaxID=543639 RepID=A0ACB8CV58_DERSI|nr:hypothetical protein HPB49_004273 [Dermacentor silvarum]
MKLRLRTLLLRRTEGPCRLCDKLADLNTRLSMLANNRDAALYNKVEALEVKLEELAIKIHQLHCHQLYVGGTISCVDDKVQSPMDTSLVTAKRGSSQVSAEPTDEQLKFSTTDASSTCADKQDRPEMPNALQPPEMCTLVSAMGDTEHGDKTPPTERTEFEHNQRSRPATGEELAERRSSLPRFSAKAVEEPKAPPNGEQPPSGTQLSTVSKPHSPAQHGRKYRKQQPRPPRLTTSQQNIKGSSTWIRPDPEVERELILVSDGNVGRIADAQHHGRVGAAHTDRHSREQTPAQPPQRLFQASMPIYTVPHWGTTSIIPLGSAASTPQHVRASRGRGTSAHAAGVPNPTVLQKHRRRYRCKRKASTINEPPIDLEWHWAGCNRTDECRKGGGVGLLWRNTTTWVPMTGSCDEHMWELSLEIVNLRADCKGEFTWCARGSRSTIDYVLVSAKLAARITQASCVRPQRRPGLHLPNRSVEQVAEDFEQCAKRREAQSYDEFVHALRSVMHEHMVRDRTAKGLDAEACATAWALYLEVKHKVQTLVQNKIADHNLRLVQSIRMEGKSAAGKFWTYVRVFGPPNMDDDCRQCDETTARPAPSSAEGTMLCGAEAETQEHLIVRCAGLQTAPAEDTDLPRALGFHMLEAEDGNHIANGRNVGRTCAVVATKKRLTEWWTSVRRM